MRARIERVWHGLDRDHRTLALQAARYGVAGVCVTLFQIGLYNLLAGPARLAPLVANTIGFAAALVLGYALHSRFSFRGHGARGSVRRTGGRFLGAGLVGYAMNSGWVWLFTGALGWKDWTPSLPMFFATPAILFELNRRWVFE